jgi:hypothetical protein
MPPRRTTANSGASIAAAATGVPFLRGLPLDQQRGRAPTRASLNMAQIWSSPPTRPITTTGTRLGDSPDATAASEVRP